MKRTRGANRSIERALLFDGKETVAGIDEVGRGAWAGPLAVGIAIITARALKTMPRGVRDSKQLTPLARERLFAPLVASVAGYAIGYASADECDALGMTAAQRVATKRALDALDVVPDAVVIDGLINYTERRDAITLVRADQRSVVVAAASVLAKVTRDRLMASMAPSFPPYGFDRNKGYASLEHRRAVKEFGLTAVHRKSWSVSDSLEFMGDPI